MKKRRLGISLYPERSTFEQDVAYLEKAAKLGFDLLFIALLGAGDRQQTIDRYKPLLAKAKELGFEIEADVNPMMFERMGINASFFHGPLELSFFTELQVDILRLDLGLNDMEEAFLSKNKEGIKICVNGCNTQDHVGHVLAAGGDRDMILGCHNYYPHRYTGVSLEHFEKGSAPMVKHNLRLQSFVTSQNPEAFGPWPVTEGLPTLEMHRDWPIEIQVGHYVMMGYVNDIIIANAYATDAELEAMAAANSTKIMFHMTPAEGLPESMKKRLRMNLSVRGDSGEWIIRTLESRMLREATEPFNTVDIQPGDVLIGMASSGVHSNGFSLVRKVFDMTVESLNTYYDELGATLGETLLAPTRIYVKALKAVKEAGVTVKACSHITGGGFYENVPRMLKEGTHAVINKNSYPVPPIFTLMAKKGNIEEHMMYNTYNMGLGMIVAVDPADVDKTMEAMKSAGDTPYVVGTIEAGEKGVTLC